jgi:X-X-X-Leu-X-X-Gly heptad repeat protein
MKARKAAAALLALAICAIPAAPIMQFRMRPVFVAKRYVVVVAISTTKQQYVSGDKNETVYAMLEPDGSVGEIYVVNQLLGEYTDYGTYSDIKNLSTESKPVVEGDRITFPDANLQGGLFYQGAMEGELPLAVSFQYRLDGAPVEADSLAGASGHLKIEINCAQNERCEERVRKGLMAQIVLNLDLSLARNVVAKGATTVVAGNTMNVAFAALPEESRTFVVETDVTDFEMDAVVITLTHAGLGSYEETIDDYEDGFNDMIRGADDMVDGTTKLKDGVEELSDGMDSLSNGLGMLKTSGADMLSGMQQYGFALQSYVQGIGETSSASQNILSGLNDLSSSGAALSDGLKQIGANAKAMASNAELYALAQSLSASGDPSVQALANGTLALLNGLDGLSGALDEAGSNVSAYAQGVQQAAGAYAQFDAGLAQAAAGGGALVSGYNDIASGFDDYQSGVGSGASGARRLARALEGLPGSIQELIDGQVEFRDGIASARDEILSKTESFSGAAPVSFASPDKNHPASVQYILMTPAIEKPSAEAETGVPEEKDTFLSRLKDLFS